MADAIWVERSGLEIIVTIISNMEERKTPDGAARLPKYSRIYFSCRPPEDGSPWVVNYDRRGMPLVTG